MELYNYSNEYETDDYQFNIITVPGLIKGNAIASGEITTMVNNAQTRGDANAHDVLCWAGLAEQNILPSVAAWVWPTLGSAIFHKPYPHIT